MGFLGLLATPLGYVMKFIYGLIPNYGWSIILFTLLIRVVSFPLQIKQQKSTARMSAYQPMIAEIQKKYAKDQQKQSEAMTELQQEYGFSPTAGCLPMALNMFVLFGVIEVVYNPIQHILHVGKEAIATAVSTLGVTATGYMTQSSLMQTIQQMSLTQATSQLSGIMTEAEVAAVHNFNMSFLGIDLSAMPHLAINALLIFPLLSVVSMVLLNIVTMKMSGQQLQGSMKYMPWITSLMFVWFAFRVPVAFSLYYTVSNLLMFLQSLLLKKIYDPEKYKQQLAEEIEAKRAAKKKKKTVRVVEKTGEVQEKEMSEAEMTRYRLELARRLDAEKYQGERTVRQKAGGETPAPEQDSVAEAAKALGEDPKEG